MSPYKKGDYDLEEGEKSGRVAEEESDIIVGERTDICAVSSNSLLQLLSNIYYRHILQTLKKLQIVNRYSILNWVLL